MLFIEQVLQAEVALTKVMVKALVAFTIIASLAMVNMIIAAAMIAIAGTVAVGAVPLGAVSILALLLAEYVRQQIATVYNTSSEHITIEQDQPQEEQIDLTNVSICWLESELAYLSELREGQIRYLTYCIPQIISQARWEVGTIYTGKDCFQLPESRFWTNGEIVGQEESFDGLLIPTPQPTKKPAKKTSPSKAPSIALEAMTWSELLAFARTHKVPVGTKGRTRKVITEELLKVIRQ